MVTASRSSKIYLGKTTVNKMEDYMNTSMHVKYSVISATAAPTEAESLICKAVGKSLTSSKLLRKYSYNNNYNYISSLYYYILHNIVNIILLLKTNYVLSFP